MDREDIRDLLGDTIFDRAKRYVGDVDPLSCSVDEAGVRHLSAKIRGSRTYRTQAWLRPNGSFVSASCSCPYNENGDGPLCKHIGALLLADSRQQETEPEETGTPQADPDQEKQARLEQACARVGVVTAEDLLHSDSYNANLNLMFGKKWREEEKKSDFEARYMLRFYQANLMEPFPSCAEGGVSPSGTVELLPELTLVKAELPWMRLRVTNGGREYVIKSVPKLLDAVEQGKTVSYGKELTFCHQKSAFSPRAQQILELLRRQESSRSDLLGEYEIPRTRYGVPAGGITLTGETFDALVEMFRPEGVLGGYRLEEGMPHLRAQVKKKKGGVLVSTPYALKSFESLNYGYLFSLEAHSLWQLERRSYQRVACALEMLCGKEVFFTDQDAAQFCSYVLPELSECLSLEDPRRLLLDQIPLEPTVQFYLDAPRPMTITAHAEFLYGEERVAPQLPPPEGLLRDVRAERRAAALLERWFEPDWNDSEGIYGVDEEERLYDVLEEGVPALLAAGEVYLSDSFRNLQAAPPRIAVGVSVHGSVLDLEVDTGEFPVGELKELLGSLRKKKRYHRLRDGRLLRLDSSLEALDELNETLELSGVALGKDAHAALPLYRAPSLDWALSGQSGVRFDRDDAFRRISRSFHAVQDSEYAPPPSLQKVLRKYQRDGYRWLRTLDGYGMGGILADDMGLGKTLQVLSYLLALKEGGQDQPSLIVCPASLVLNWAEECRRFTPGLRCVVVDGGAARRGEAIREGAEADLLVTSYDLLRRDEEKYSQQEFYACILDEAQAIKNHSTQKYKAVCRIRSRVRFALTGTPVENRLSELWSIFSFLMPGYLPPYKSFCTRFEKPIVQEQDAAAARRLNQLTGPFILRRMKSQVLKELPPKTENVYRIEMEPKQRKLYLAAVLDAREKLHAARPEDKMAVFAVLMRLRQICCDPRLVTDDWDGGSAKLDACAELVSAAVEGGHRILLFSQFTTMLDLLAQRLDELGLSHFTLEGATPKPQRAELVRRFNGGEADVFLISLRAGGTGLNLTAADIVIHYDPWWNLAAQNQATDRAYRIGQQNAVQVYKLIAQDTIEEKILELQQAKQSLADTVTGGADGGILSMKPEELLALLESEA